MATKGTTTSTKGIVKVAACKAFDPRAQLIRRQQLDGAVALFLQMMRPLLACLRRRGPGET